MERLFKGDQAYALAAATAHEFNNELTVILSSIATLIGEMPPGQPGRDRAIELQDAAQRCAQRTADLLRFGVRRGPRVLRASLERLIDED